MRSDKGIGIEKTTWDVHAMYSHTCNQSLCIADPDVLEICRGDSESPLQDCHSEAWMNLFAQYPPTGFEATGKCIQYLKDVPHIMCNAALNFERTLYAELC